MSNNEGLHIEKRKYIRYEKHIPIIVNKLKNDYAGKFHTVESQSKIVPIKRGIFANENYICAELFDISAGGLSIYSTKELALHTTYYSIIQLTTGEKIELYYTVKHAEPAQIEEHASGIIYGCKFIGVPPALPDSLDFEDFLDDNYFTFDDDNE